MTDPVHSHFLIKMILLGIAAILVLIFYVVERKKINAYAISLAKSDSTDSSKRFIILASFGLITIVTLCNLFFGLYIRDEYYFSLVGIVCSGMGFTVYESIKSLPKTPAP